MATRTTTKNNLVVCDQCHKNVERERFERHQTEECQKQASIQEQQETVKQRLQWRHQAIKQLMNELNGVVKNQYRNHSQLWMIMAVAFLLALVVGFNQKQTVPQQEVTQALTKSIAMLAQRLKQPSDMSQAVKETLKAMLKVNGSNHELEQELTKLFQIILCPEPTPNQPAPSCQQILNCDISSPSGYYWIASADGNATKMYCSMNRVCGGVSGGWMRVAELDMTNSSSQCPSGLREVVHSGQKLCGNGKEEGCSECLFNVSNVRYEQVCSKIIAYQFGSTNSFYRMYNYNETIDENYFDGVSLTYSKNPRKHIWSFAAALDEVGTMPESNCPCTNTNLAAKATAPPDFVGNDYFCDTGSTSIILSNRYILYADDPLWDGAGCGPDNTCCSLNNPPWFFKQLPSSTSEDIEMRVCCDQRHDDENIYIEQIELYVR